MITFKHRTALATLVFEPQRDWVLQDVIDVLTAAGLQIEGQSHSLRPARSDVLELQTASMRILLARTHDDQVTIGVEAETDAKTQLEALIAPLGQAFALSACIWAPKTKILTMQSIDIAAEDVRYVRSALPRPIRIVPTPMQSAFTGLKSAGASLLSGLTATPRTDP